MASKIIYIVGGGHSGSTLLDMLIGSCEEVVSLGEVYFFNSYNSNDFDPKLYLVRQRDCTCGKAFSKCEFWEYIRKKLGREINIPRKVTLNETAKTAWNMCSPWSRRFLFPLSRGDDRAFFEAVDSTLYERGSKHKYLVDSSKDPRRLVRIVQSLGADRIKAIHLVRDGRGYAASYNSRSKKRVAKWGLKPQSAVACAVRWACFNLATRIYLKKVSIDCMHISYDLFCQHPAKYITQLNDWLQIDVPKDYARGIGDTLYHNIHGNLLKFEKLDAIKHDDSWREELSPLKKLVLSTMVYPFNVRWVMHDDVSRIAN